MIKIKNKQQLIIPGFEEWRNMFSPRKFKIVQKSWAGVFQEHILPLIPVKKMSKLYSSNHGRPGKELYSLMGAVILQQFFNLTDEETIAELAFNQKWHFALECYDEADQLVSLKTLWTMRDQMLNYDLVSQIFDLTTDKLIDFFDVDVSKQRLDSVHVYSNMAHLGRIRILSRTLISFLKNLKRRHPNIFSSKISSGIIEKYLQKRDSSYFSQTKPDKAQHTLEDIANDIYSLKLIFDMKKKVRRMNSFKLLERVFDEHCSVESGQVLIKSSKEVPSDSVQNPSDPDAGYDAHKGKGYQTQLSETYSTAEDKKKSDKPILNLITYAETESADKHDSHALEPALKNMTERGHKIETNLADTSYTSNKNVDKAAEYGVELIGPTPGKDSEERLSCFEFDSNNDEIICCFNKKSPDEIKHNKKSTITATWYKSTCANCPYADICSTKKCKKGRKIYYTIASLKSFRRRQYEKSDEFIDKYRYRSGIEATNSRFIHMTSARRSRYRGLKKIRFGQKLKALAINVFRVVKYLEKCTKNGNILQYFVDNFKFPLFFAPNLKNTA